MIFSRDISSKVNPTTRQLISDLNASLRAAKIEYMVIGATARDLIFESVFGIKVRRVTVDVDFAVQVATWEAHESLAADLVKSGNFRKDSKHKQRFWHRSGVMTDIVPFGRIEQTDGSIAWPPDSDIVMSTLGLREAMAMAIHLQIGTEPPLVVRVCSPASQAMLKLIIWSERKYTVPGKADARDLAFIVEHYQDIEEIYPADSATIADVPEDIDRYENISAWILGDHIASMVGGQLRQRLEEILKAEMDESGDQLLIRAMTPDESFFGEDRSYDTNRQTLSALLRGLRQT